MKNENRQAFAEAFKKVIEGLKNLGEGNRKLDDIMHWFPNADIKEVRSWMLGTSVPSDDQLKQVRMAAKIFVERDDSNSERRAAGAELLRLLDLDS